MLPDQYEINAIQAARLGELTGLRAAAFDRLTIAELRTRLGWQIDPRLLLFRHVGGRVVQRDAATGDVTPLGGATVRLMDATCTLLCSVAHEATPGWIVPVPVAREEMASVTTAADGSFSVWIPRFEIESILLWRRKHPALAEAISDHHVLELPAIGDESLHIAGTIASMVATFENVPDIVFDVSRTNADGAERVIHTGRYFDVRWTIGHVPDVELVTASRPHGAPFAIAHEFERFLLHTGCARDLAPHASAGLRRRAG